VLQATSQAPVVPVLAQTGEPFATPAQAAPHLPQLVKLLLRSTQAPPQSAKPILHATPQAPAPHAGEPFAVVGHAAPQSPQFCGSETTATHEPLQLLCVIGQVNLQTPPEQASPAAQAWPHEPQLLGS
jgi:hypothetical protein